MYVIYTSLNNRAQPIPFNNFLSFSPIPGIESAARNGHSSTLSDVCTVFPPEVITTSQLDQIKKTTPSFKRGWLTEPVSIIALRNVS